MKRNTGNLLPFLTRKAGTSAVFGVVCLLGLTRPSDPAFALEYDGGIAVISLHGFIEGRALSGSRALSWENGGFGKTPFGGRQSGENRAIGHVQTGAALQIRYGWDWSANVIVTASGRQYHTVDLQEVFLRYKPAPTGDIAIDARIGIMFPPVSLENDGIAWTSPFTLSPSAINAWIGDEVRGLGGELAASWRFNIANENLRLRADAGLFGYDDPAGALLAWRGWAVHDQTAGVFERHQLPPIRTLRPGGNIAQQAPWVEPFHELGTL